MWAGVGGLPQRFNGGSISGRTFDRQT